MAQARRGPAPVPGASASIRIENCPTDGVVQVCFLGSYSGTFTHFVKKKCPSIPCLGDEDCPKALHAKRKVWKGYAPAERWRGGPYQDWLTCVFEITESLDEVLHNVQLRGTIWEVKRVIGECGRPEVSAVQIDQIPERELQSAFDVYPAVHRMYGFLSMQWGVKSHIPYRVRLQPIKRQPPAQTASEAANGAKHTEEISREERAKVKALLAEHRASLGRPTTEGSERNVFKINGHEQGVKS